MADTATRTTKTAWDSPILWMAISAAVSIAVSAAVTWGFHRRHVAELSAMVEAWNAAAVREAEIDEQLRRSLEPRLRFLERHMPADREGSR